MRPLASSARRLRSAIPAQNPAAASGKECHLGDAVGPQCSQLDPAFVLRQKRRQVIHSASKPRPRALSAGVHHNWSKSPPP